MKENNEHQKIAAEYLALEEKPIDIRDLLDGYLRFWKWFVLGGVLALVMAVIYLKLTKPVYLAVASVILEDEKRTAPTSDARGYVDLNMIGGLGTSSIENELGLMRSKRLMLNAVKALGLNVQYFSDKGLTVKELYAQSPYKLRLMRLDASALQKAMDEEQNLLIITEVDQNTVKIEQVEGKYKATHKLGEIVEMGFADFIVEPNNKWDTLTSNIERNIQVHFLTVNQVATSLQSQLEVALIDENSTLIKLSLEGTVRQKAEDILDQLIFEYNQEAIENKNLIARNTAFFIDERLNIINSELDSVETGKEQFKSTNQLTDIETESSIIIQDVSDYKNKQQEVSTELEVINAMITHLGTNDSNLLPTNLGIDESGTNALIEEFNNLVLERNRLLTDATERNPTVVRLTDQIQQIKNNVQASLERRRSNLVIAQDNLGRQAGILGSHIAEVPAQERRFRSIERQQNIKEALYLFLLQKREENSLSLAAKAPKAKIVDEAYSFNNPISPNKKMVLGLALMVGLFIPFLSIHIQKLINTKINTRKELKELAQGIPIVGEIPHVLAGEPALVSIKERSLLCESFNILSANLQYELKKTNTISGGTCIFTTSSVQGEGKTFSVVNLGMTLALSGKSVILIGADLRNPQLQRYEDGALSTKGLSRYLEGPHLAIVDFIEDSKLHKNLKVLPSGPIPANPTQLLRNDKIGPMFEELKNSFDYIIVDTAPALLLADTFLISHYADLTLYLIRAGQTKKKVLEFALEAKADNKLKNLGFLLNDVKMADTSYGYIYGYPYKSGNARAL
ncbi:GumC family protein [Kriegella aquimaris]|uniref:non-specific protein-tyrosine kinase n=1 Tax=Kriegella aquimaris TaxID=192904 RepID=A0A1G9U633_9FLAO|nr:polysaccharide biosynthesis tyrosine autokinase [Kriegella aquimaris]SDM55312.1 capsular exopolysaccharide family [Kriegella aquimaris]